MDEAFLRLPPLPPADLAAYAAEIRSMLRQHTKLPSSVGIATTKTLAKAANKRAKKMTSGVLVVHSEDEADALLESTPTEDIWNVGPKRAWLLATELNIHNGLQLKHAPERWIKQRLSVVGLRTVLELRGIPCVPLETVAEPKQQIACAQAFGAPVEDLGSLKEATASYMARAAQRLRAQHSRASHITVYLQTNPFRVDQPQYARSSGTTLAEPTNATGPLITAAHALLTALYRPNFSYHRVGVFLQGLTPEQPTQLSLFTSPEHLAKQEAASRVADTVNAKLGRGTITFAATGTTHPWQAKSANRSPCWTTRLSELPEVR